MSLGDGASQDAGRLALGAWEVSFHEVPNGLFQSLLRTAPEAKVSGARDRVWELSGTARQAALSSAGQGSPQARTPLQPVSSGGLARGSEQGPG